MKEFLGLKPKVCSFLVDDRSEHKKAKGVNKNDVATICHKMNSKMFCWIIDL